MDRKIFVPVLALLLIISGCSLAPKYTRPGTPVPNQWPTGASYQASKPSDTLQAADLKWREFFTDERLQKVIIAALVNNRDMRLAALNAEKARALYGVQRAELYPAVNANAGWTRQRVPGDLSTTGSSMTSDQYNVSLGITSWEIDFFGRIRSLKDQALETYFATDQARRSAQILLISGAANAWLSLAADRENLKLSRATLEAQEASYNLIQKRFDMGVANELDLRRSQSQVDTARGDVARYTQLVAQDENALTLLIGSQLPQELLPADLDAVRGPRDISAGLSSEVLLNRPDVLAAEHQLKAAYANIGAARAAFFPRISLTTGAGTASAELSGLFKDNQYVWNFTPLISIPIFDARVWSAYKVRKVEREISVAQYEKAIQTAFREVADALAVKGTVEQRIAAQQSLVDALSVTYRLSDLRYTRGIDSYLSVLDAQRSLYGAQQALITLKLTKISNQVTLYSVLGGGVQ